MHLNTAADGFYAVSRAAFEGREHSEGPASLSFPLGVLHSLLE